MTKPKSISFRHLANVENLDDFNKYDLYSWALGNRPRDPKVLIDAIEKHENIVLQEIYEPMAGTAEFSYYGHFWYPKKAWRMTDIDREAIAYTTERGWSSRGNTDYQVENLLSVATQCQQVSEIEDSMAFVGKQSFSIFNPKDFAAVLSFLLKRHTYLVLDMWEARYTKGWDNLPTPTVLTNGGYELGIKVNKNHFAARELDFSLVIRKGESERELWRYEKWHDYSVAEVLHLTQVLGMEVDAWFMQGRQLHSVWSKHSYDPSKDVYLILKLKR